MKNFEFQVEQVSTAPGVHSWVAVNIQTKKRIDLPNGGGSNFVGQYPEIQDELATNHQISAPLIYVTQLDSLLIHPNGHADWTFRRAQAQVIVHDIPRVVASLTIQG